MEKKAADDDAAAGRRMAKAAARDNILIFLCSFRYVNTSSDNVLLDHSIYKLTIILINLIATDDR